MNKQHQTQMLMEAKDDAIILEGTFSKIGAGAIISLIIAILFLWGGVSFLFDNDPELAGISTFLLGLGAIPFIIFLIIVLRRGKIRITETHVVGKRTLGKGFSIPWSEVVWANIQPNDHSFTYSGGVVLSDKNSKLQADIKGINPKFASGVIWAINRYKEHIPMDVLSGIGKQRKVSELPEGIKAVSRQFYKTDKTSFEDTGLCVMHDNNYYYIPTTRTETPYENYLVASYQQYVRVEGMPDRHQMPLQELMQTIYESNASAEDKTRYFEVICKKQQGTMYSHLHLQSNNYLVQPGDEEGVKVKVDLGAPAKTHEEVEQGEVTVGSKVLGVVWPFIIFGVTYGIFYAVSEDPNTLGLWVAIGLGAVGLMGTYKFWTDPNAMGGDERVDDQETDKHTSDI